MTRCSLTGAILPALLAMALLGTVSCDDDEPEDREGRRLLLSATPSLVSLLEDPSGTSTVEATLQDLNEVAIEGDTIDFSFTADPTGNQALDPPSGPTDASGKITATFTSDAPTTATVTATNPSTSLASLAFIRVVMPVTHTLSPSTSDPDLTSCTDTVTLIGELEDTDGNPISGASVTFAIVSSSIDGAPANLDGTFSPATATTNSAGSYAVALRLVELECTSMCVGTPTPECQVVVKATSLGLDSNTEPITEGF